MSDLIQRGEKLILRSSDPAVDIVPGFRRFLVGLDIAQAVDQNAFAIILDEQVPFWGEAGQELSPRRREVIRAERIPQMTYTNLAKVTRTLMADPALADSSYLVVDASGVGRAFCDLLNSENVTHTRLQITSGENESESESKERGVTFNNVSKNLLMNTLNGALHTKELRLSNFPLRDEVQLELESFEATFGKSGRMTIQGGTKAGHADIAMAAAQAYWLSDHRTVGTLVGEVALQGYW